MFNWDNTKAALQDLHEVLVCKKCKKIPGDPVNYNMCGHFFCKACVRANENDCPTCGVPSLASEITSDQLIANLIVGWKKICSIVGFKGGVDCLDLHSAVSEIKNDIAKSYNNTENSKASKRISETAQERSSLTEEPFTKKRKHSKSKETCMYDTQKSSTVTIVRKSRASRNTAAKDINKRNVKGETQLHVACIKGKLEDVKTLLVDGANPNTKDHAGWTPLLEAVHHGFVDIAELLVQYGAMVNVPGCDNITPLHEAVLNKKLDIVKLLVMYGANAEARDVSGKTPRDISKTEEMLTALNSGTSVRVMKPLAETKVESLDPGHVILFGCGLNKQEQKQLVTLTQQLKLKMMKSYSSEITHIVVPTDASSVCSASYDIIQGILQGKWIVNCSWLSVCLKMGKLIHPQEFEVRGTSHFPDSDAPRRGRTNADKQASTVVQMRSSLFWNVTQHNIPEERKSQFISCLQDTSEGSTAVLPGIFNGCHIYLAGAGTTYTFGNSKLTKTDIVTLIRSGNGLVLSREPDPESIPSGEQTVPYHASCSSSLAKCSHYIIYRMGKDEPKLKYNMAHIKSLSIKWLFDCVESFSLREPV